MKKTMLAMLVLAGLSLLTGILMKFGAVPHILRTVPSSFVQLSQLFLLAAIAFGIYGHNCCKKE
jgi:hypothetical protein